MGRPPRADNTDFEAFERLIAEGLPKFPVDLIAYQCMSNHWHMVMSPQVDGGMSAFIGWITLTHTQLYSPSPIGSNP